MLAQNYNVDSPAEPTLATASLDMGRSTVADGLIGPRSSPPAPRHPSDISLAAKRSRASCQIHCVPTAVPRSCNDDQVLIYPQS
jgi:hypothetical protein